MERDSQQESSLKTLPYHQRVNFLALAVDATGWWLGMSFISFATILPLFIRHLGGNNTVVGLIPSLWSLGILLPQILVARRLERKPYVKGYTFTLAILERLPVLVLALSTLFLIHRSPSTLLLITFFCLGINALFMGLNMPAYTLLVAKAIPPHYRGRLYGISGAIGGLLGIAGSWLSGWYLIVLPKPLGFTLCFTTAFVLLALSVFPIAFVKETPTEPSPSQEAQGKWYEIFHLFGKDRGFLALIIAESFFASASVGPSFYMVYADDRFPWEKTLVRLFNVTATASMFIGGLLWGHMADRFGNRRVLRIGAGLMAGGLIVALLAPSGLVLSLAVLLSTLGAQAYELSNFNILMEYAGPRRVPTYTAARSLLIAPVRSLFPVGGGRIADLLGHRPLFFIGVIAAGICFFLLRRVREPRYTPSEGEVAKGGDLSALIT